MRLIASQSLLETSIENENENTFVYVMMVSLTHLNLINIWPKLEELDH